MLLWVNISGEWMVATDGYWGDDHSPDPIVLRGAFWLGNISEGYPSGTLNVENRAKEFIDDYLKRKAKIAKAEQKFNQG